MEFILAIFGGLCAAAAGLYVVVLKVMAARKPKPPKPPDYV